METFLNQVTSFSSMPQFTAFTTALTNFFNGFLSRDVFNSTQIDSFLNVVQTGILFLIGVVKQAVVTALSIADLVILFTTTMLNATIYIPLVSDIFEYLTGESSTFGNIVSYMLAIPITILWHIAVPGTDFPSTWPTSAEDAAKPYPLTKRGTSGKEISDSVLPFPSIMYIIAGCVKLVSFPFAVINDLVSLASELPYDFSIVTWFSTRMGYLEATLAVCNVLQWCFLFPWHPTQPTGLQIYNYTRWVWLGIGQGLISYNLFKKNKKLGYATVAITAIQLCLNVGYVIYGCVEGFTATSNILSYCDAVIMPIEFLVKFILKLYKENPYAAIAIPICSTAFPIILFTLRLSSALTAPTMTSTKQITSGVKITDVTDGEEKKKLIDEDKSEKNEKKVIKYL